MYMSMYNSYVCILQPFLGAPFAPGSYMYSGAFESHASPPQGLRPAVPAMLG